MLATVVVLLLHTVNNNKSNVKIESNHSVSRKHYSLSRCIKFSIFYVYVTLMKYITATFFSNQDEFYKVACMYISTVCPPLCHKSL